MPAVGGGTANVYAPGEWSHNLDVVDLQDLDPVRVAPQRMSLPALTSLQAWPRPHRHPVPCGAARPVACNWSIRSR